MHGGKDIMSKCALSRARISLPPADVFRLSSATIAITSTAVAAATTTIATNALLGILTAVAVARDGRCVLYTTFGADCSQAARRASPSPASKRTQSHYKRARLARLFYGVRAECGRVVSRAVPGRNSDDCTSRGCNRTATEQQPR